MPANGEYNVAGRGIFGKRDATSTKRMRRNERVGETERSIAREETSGRAKEPARDKAESRQISLVQLGKPEDVGGTLRGLFRHAERGRAAVGERISRVHVRRKMDVRVFLATA